MNCCLCGVNWIIPLLNDGLKWLIASWDRVACCPLNHQRERHGSLIFSSWGKLSLMGCSIDG